MCVRVCVCVCVCVRVCVLREKMVHWSVNGECGGCICACMLRCVGVVVCVHTCVVRSPPHFSVLFFHQKDRKIEFISLPVTIHVCVCVCVCECVAHSQTVGEPV